MAPGELEQLLKHSEGARRLAQGLLGGVHGGDDVAQDALVTALRKAPTGLRNPRAWLYKVTRTQARENARKESRRRRHEGAAARSDVVDRSADVAKRAALQKQLIDAVLRLPEAYRVPVWMRFFDEVPPRKIAAALDLPVETARTRIRRGLERLRVDLDREHGGDDRWRAALLPLLGEMGGAMGAKSFAGSVAVLVLVGALIATAVAWLGSDEGLPGAPDGELLAGKPAKSEVALVGRSVDSADELPPGRFKIDGIVEDGDGKPLADIPVVLKQAMPEFGFLDGRNGDWLATSYARRDFGDVLRESTSGADGSFRFEGLPAGRFCVEARAPAPWTSGYATAGLGVVDRRVRLVRQDKGSRRVPLRRQLLTRPDGTFDFASLRPGRYQVRVDAGSEWVPTPWIAVEAGLDDMAITLQRGSTVQGRVVGSSGAPLPNVHVHFSWQAVVGVHRHGSSTARTDAAGAFTLTRVAPRAVGTLRVEGHYTPETTWNAASLKDIAAGSKGHVLTLKPGVFVSGEVVGPDGEDVQAWLVHCVNLKTKAETRGAFGADRRKFRVGPLEPGQYTLGFLVSGEHVAPEPTTVTAPASGLRIVAPRGVMLEGRITNGKPDVHLQGVIFGPTSTKPLFSVNVTGTGHFGLAVRSDAPHTLYFFGPAGSSRFALLENVLPSKGPYEIALRQGGVIRGRFEEVSSDPEQAPYVYVMSPIGFHVTGVVAKEGTFAIRGVPPGTYELIGFPDRHSRQTIEGVQVGDTGLVVRRPK